MKIGTLHSIYPHTFQWSAATLALASLLLGACGFDERASEDSTSEATTSSACDPSDAAALSNAVDDEQGAEAQLGIDEDNLNREQYLFSEGATSENEMNQAALKVAQSQATLRSAKAKVVEMQANCASDTCAAAKARLEEARGAVDSAQAQVDYDVQYAKGLAEACPDAEPPPACSQANVTAELDIGALRKAHVNANLMELALCNHPAGDTPSPTPNNTPPASTTAKFYISHALEVPSVITDLAGLPPDTDKSAWCVVSTTESDFVTGVLDYTVSCQGDAGAMTTGSGSGYYVATAGAPYYLSISHACEGQVVSATCGPTENRANP